MSTHCTPSPNQAFSDSSQGVVVPPWELEAEQDFPVEPHTNLDQPEYPFINKPEGGPFHARHDQVPEELTPKVDWQAKYREKGLI